MADNPLTPDDVARQLQQHLTSLRQAGIEWGPAPDRVAPLPLPTVVPEVQTSLFAAAPAEAPAPGSREQRQADLDALRQKVAACTRCPQLASTRTQTVFGVGPLDAELCFIGEAPGAEEDRQGEPFVGPAGQLLTRIITACGLRREDVYICNILRCRPPGNRQPQPDEAAHCSEYLERTIELVAPKYLVALGGTATRYLLGTETGITRLRGKFFEYRGVPVLCTFHPSYLLRSPDKKKDVWEDMKLLLTRMGRPIPGRSG